MKLSQYFLPILKEDPREATIVSHKFMLRAGMIRQLASGIYNWLPMGLKVLKNIENIVRDELDKSGAIELLMPTMQPAELWQESGRGDYGKETLFITDRHGKNFIYGPTNEEVITDLFRNNVKSYKDLPFNLYHIQWKFRDEIRPRFGVMRGREFLMKDAYSFHADEASAIDTYNLMFKTYLSIFKRLEVQAIPFRADTGAIGGNLSHEFQIIASTGESQIYYDSEYESVVAADEVDIEKAKSMYARADEMHIAEECDLPEGRLKTARGIEVGHIFYLGEKYSEAMGAKFQNKEGVLETVKMGCYGIGVSRLVGAIIEACHDEKGIVWPESVAPFRVVLINLKPSDADTNKICEDLYKQFGAANVEVLYDDKDEGAGVKLARFELIGVPYAVVIGPRGVKDGVAEVITRKTLAKQNVEFGKVLDFVKG